MCIQHIFIDWSRSLNNKNDQFCLFFSKLISFLTSYIESQFCRSIKSNRCNKSNVASGKTELHIVITENLCNCWIIKKSDWISVWGRCLDATHIGQTFLKIPKIFILTYSSLKWNQRITQFAKKFTYLC